VGLTIHSKLDVSKAVDEAHFPASEQGVCSLRSIAVHGSAWDRVCRGG